MKNDPEHAVITAVKQFNKTSLTSMEQTIQNLYGISIHPVSPKGSADTDSPPIPNPQQLADLLNNVHEAPGETTIVTVPPKPENYELELISNVQLLQSYIATLAAMSLYANHPNPYNLANPKEATAFVNDSATYKNYVLTGGLVKDITTYLPGMKTSSYNKSFSATEVTLHLDFLTAIFEGMTLPEDVFAQMDSILTSVTESLKDLNMEFENEDETLNHAISYYYLEEVEGSSIKVMKLRFIYVNISQKSWIESIDSKEEAKHLEFTMRVFDSESEMNNAIVSNAYSKIASTLQALTGNDVEAINSLINAQGVTTDNATQSAGGN